MRSYSVFFLHWLYQFMLREGFTYNNKNSNYNTCHSLSNYDMSALCEVLYMDYLI